MTATASEPRKGMSITARGEDAAAAYLTRRGYEILQRDWEGAAGSMDIIARDGDALVFVDVAVEASVTKGFPGEPLTRESRERAEKVAAAYVADSDLTEMMVRFDTLGIIVLDSDRIMVRHHTNAMALG